MKSKGHIKTTDPAVLDEEAVKSDPAWKAPRDLLAELSSPAGR